MARSTYLGTASDMLLIKRGSSLGVATKDGVLRFWDAKTGGSQHTDLLLDGVAVTEVPVPAGTVIAPAVELPDGVDGGAWVEYVLAGETTADAREFVTPSRPLQEAKAHTDAAVAGIVIPDPTPASIGAETPAGAQAKADAAETAATAAAQQLVDALKANAPAAYDTLVEIATKLNADDDVTAQLLADVADKVDAADLDTLVAAEAQTDGSELKTVLSASIATETASPADVLPNESPFWWTTEPQSYGGRVYDATAGDNNDVYLREWSQPQPDGPFWLRRYYLGHVVSGAAMDDHQAPGLAVATGKPIVAFYSSHNYDNVLYYRATTRNVEDIEPGKAEFGPTQTFEVPASQNTSYAEVMVHGDDIYVLHRTGNAADRWSLTKFPAWATGTPQRVELLSSADQFYTKGRIVGDTLRVMVSDHPSLGTDNKVWYVQVDLLTGAVAKSDGTVLGNLDGTNLPIAEASLELVYTATGSERPWVFDVGYGATPELVFTSGENPPGFTSTADYYYAKLVAGAWVVNTISPVGSFLGGNYFPSIVFDPQTPGAVVLARESGGVYSIERHTTADDGATWSAVVLDSTSDTTLTRAFAVNPVDGAAPIFDVLATEIDEYPTYTGPWVSRFRPLPRTQGTRRLPDIDASDEPAAPESGLYLPGTAGAYISTPDTAANSLSSGIALEADVALNSWASGSVQNLIAKEQNTTSRSIRLVVNSDGKLGIFWSADGSAALSLLPGTPLPFSPGQRARVRASFVPNYNGSAYRLRMAYRLPEDDQWTELSTTQVGPVTSIFDSTSPWEIGARWGGTFELAAGTFYSASVRTAGGDFVTGWRGDHPQSPDRYRDKNGNVWIAFGLQAATPRAKAKATANTSLSSAAVTVLALPAEEYDNAGLHSTVSTNWQVKLGKVGAWLVIGQVGYDANATGRRMALINKNGAEVSRNVIMGAAGALLYVQTSAVVIADATTDYVELGAFQDSGGALNTVASACHLTVAYLGP